MARDTSHPGEGDLPHPATGAVLPRHLPAPLCRADTVVRWQWCTGDVVWCEVTWDVYVMLYDNV